MSRLKEEIRKAQVTFLKLSRKYALQGKLGKIASSAFMDTSRLMGAILEDEKRRSEGK